MFILKYVFAAVFLALSLQGFPQLFHPAEYPRNYFRDPLNIPISLAANFGELRTEHYHMGLDIRTQHRVNLPVYAAADGYIARVSIAPGGFGQAVYINHPNGYTTVYGHLNRFFPALEAYVHREQYRRQSWQVNLELPPSQFRVKKGDLIARSGNTGGSQGPHLHFEIRRTAEDINLNPLLFGLPVEDHTPPHIVRLAWYDRNKGIYEQSPHVISTIPALLTVTATRISFAISAFDTQTGSNNPDGIFEAALEEDGRPVIGFQLDHISYDDTRNINAHIDYKTKETGGPYLQQLFFLPGYPVPSIYVVPSPSDGPAGRKTSDPAALIADGLPAPDGVLDIGDGRPHRIVIRVRDANDNQTGKTFDVQYVPAPAADSPASRPPGVPLVSASAGAKRFYPGMLDGIELPDCAFFLGEHSLYDSVVIGAIQTGYPGSGISLPGAVSAAYAIGAPWIPLDAPVLVRLRPLPPAGDSLRHEEPSIDRVVMVCWNKADKDVQRPEWKDGWASARFREFGQFQLVRDTTAPTIDFIGIRDGADLGKASRISIAVHDNLGATAHFRAELDGAWVCFTNDKNLAWIYSFDEHCPTGRHTLRVSIEDVAGNRTIHELNFTR
jgi:murein DD-endopeptidase MepM/ murein hydrolase activator NlpD